MGGVFSAFCPESNGPDAPQKPKGDGIEAMQAADAAAGGTGEGVAPAEAPPA